MRAVFRRSENPRGVKPFSQILIDCKCAPIQALPDARHSALVRSPPPSALPDAPIAEQLMMVDGADRQDLLRITAGNICACPQLIAYVPHEQILEICCRLF